LQELKNDQSYTLKPTVYFAKKQQTIILQQTKPQLLLPQKDKKSELQL
jgi:hypothetical protein